MLYEKEWSKRLYKEARQCFQYQSWHLGPYFSIFACTRQRWIGRHKFVEKQTESNSSCLSRRRGSVAEEAAYQLLLPKRLFSSAPQQVWKVLKLDTHRLLMSKAY